MTKLLYGEDDTREDGTREDDMVNGILTEQMKGRNHMVIRGGRRKHVFQGVIRFVQRKGRSHKREISDGLRRVYKFPVLFRRNCRHSQPQGPY